MRKARDSPRVNILLPPGALLRLGYTSPWVIRGNLKGDRSSNSGYRGKEIQSLRNRDDFLRLLQEKYKELRLK